MTLDFTSIRVVFLLSLYSFIPLCILSTLNLHTVFLFVTNVWQICLARRWVVYRLIIAEMCVGDGNDSFLRALRTEQENMHSSNSKADLSGKVFEITSSTTRSTSAHLYERLAGWRLWYMTNCTPLKLKTVKVKNKKKGLNLNNLFWFEED